MPELGSRLQGSDGSGAAEVDAMPHLSWQLAGADRR